MSDRLPKCDNCRYDIDTKRTNDKCHYCLDYCNYKEKAKGRILQPVLLYSLLAIVLIINIFLVGEY